MWGLVAPHINTLKKKSPKDHQDIPTIMKKNLEVDCWKWQQLQQHHTLAEIYIVNKKCKVW